MTMSVLRSGKVSLILDFGTIPVLPGAMCWGKSRGAKMVPTTVSSNVGDYPAVTNVLIILKEKYLSFVM